LIKGIEVKPGKCQLGRTDKHCVIEAEYFEAGQIGECLESAIEVGEVLFDATREFAQHHPRRRGIRVAHLTGRLDPREESADGVCFVPGLAFLGNSLACFYKTDIGHMHRELSPSCAIKQLRCRKDLVMRWSERE